MRFTFGKGQGAQEYWSNLRGDYSRTTLPEVESFLEEGLRPFATDFVEAGATYGLDPLALASIARLKTKGGTSAAFRNENNAMGLKGPLGPRSFSSVKESIFAAAEQLDAQVAKSGDGSSGSEAGRALTRIMQGKWMDGFRVPAEGAGPYRVLVPMAGTDGTWTGEDLNPAEHIQNYWHRGILTHKKSSALQELKTKEVLLKREQWLRDHPDAFSPGETVAFHRLSQLEEEQLLKSNQRDKLPANGNFIRVSPHEVVAPGVVKVHGGSPGSTQFLRTHRRAFGKWVDEFNVRASSREEWVAANKDAFRPGQVVAFYELALADEQRLRAKGRLDKLPNRGDFMRVDENEVVGVSVLKPRNSPFNQTHGKPFKDWIKDSRNSLETLEEDVYDAAERFLSNRKEYAELAKATEAPAMRRFYEAKGLWPALLQLAKEPQIAAYSITESGRAMVEPILAGVAGGRIGGAPGAVVGGAAGGFHAEYLHSYGEGFERAAEDRNIDISMPEGLLEALDHPEILDEANLFAIRRAGPIAAADGMTFGLSRFGTTRLSKALAEKTIARGVAVGAVEQTLNFAGGAAGEFVAQSFAGQRYDPQAVLLEGVGQTGMSVALHTVDALIRGSGPVKEPIRLIEDLDENGLGIVYIVGEIEAESPESLRFRPKNDPDTVVEVRKRPGNEALIVPEEFSDPNDPSIRELGWVDVLPEDSETVTDDSGEATVQLTEDVEPSAETSSSETVEVELVSKKPTSSNTFDPAQREARAQRLEANKGVLVRLMSKVGDALDGQIHVLDREAFESRTSHLSDADRLRAETAHAAVLPNPETGKTDLLLDADRITPDTLVHELAGHVYLRWARQNRTQQWEKGVAMLRQNQEVYEQRFHEATDNRYRDLEGVALQEEMLAWAMGEQGYETWIQEGGPGAKHRLRNWWNSSRREMQGMLGQDIDPNARLDDLAQAWNLQIYDRGLRPGRAADPGAYEEDGAAFGNDPDDHESSEESEESGEENGDSDPETSEQELAADKLDRRYLFRGDEEYRKGDPIGREIERDVEPTDFILHVLKDKGDGTLTSFSLELGEDDRVGGAARFGKGKNWKVLVENLRTLEKEGKIRIFTPDDACSIVKNSVKKRERRDASSVRNRMKENNEILIQGRIPSEMVERADG